MYNFFCKNKKKRFVYKNALKKYHKNKSNELLFFQISDYIDFYSHLKQTHGFFPFLYLKKKVYTSCYQYSKIFTKNY